MIKKLLIQNFQCHEKRKIEFDAKITTIVGASDKGKSAIIRALKWVCLNQPVGSDFIRDGAKRTTVSVYIDDNKITRKRNKSGSTNSYRINNGTELKAFGRGIPDNVANALAMQPSVNWQGQHDAPYWFSESAGEVSRRLNAIIDLSIIDESLAIAGKETRKAKSTLDVLEDQLSEATKKHKELKWVLEAEKEWDRVEDLGIKYSEINKEIYSLRTAIEGAYKADNAHEQAQEQKKEFAGILGIASRAKEEWWFHDRLESILEIVRSAKTSHAPPDTEALTRNYTEWKVCSEKKERLAKLIENAKRLKETTCQLKSSLKKIILKLPQKCPTCGTLTRPTS